ncbi:uncharacterized protein LOC122056132 [Zingiber officinale]|uniref:Uncharacterized protein n=1 Tax=Zingiber officinale TaxID=94328 RepID=A0A8J5H1H4_ZINOF|nr:uncharacterized protein LOC122056132 [Zingiber officinale]KAG6517794.1 hypothetical protein ZIOFF_021193 [Zingiber officinale]
MSPSHEECHCDTSRNPIYSDKKKFELSPSGTITSSGSWTDVSMPSDVVMSSGHMANKYVYKRRKLQGNSLALLPEDNNITDTDKEQFELPPREPVVSSGSWTSVSNPNELCTSSGHKSDGYSYVYKRRKLQRNSLALLPEDNNITDGTQNFGAELCIGSKDCLLEVHKADPETTPVAVPTINIDSFQDSGLHDMCSIGEFRVLDKTNIVKFSKSTQESYHNLNDRSSSSKSNLELTSTFIKIHTDDPSSDVLELGEFNSAKDLCIYVLKKHGLIGNCCPSSSHSDLQIPFDDNSKLSQICKKCGLFDDPLQMLICDQCDETYHQSCCVPRVTKIPGNEWYCQLCFKKRPKLLISKSPDTIGEISGHTYNISSRKYSISFMLKDSKPYTTGVRIGKDFQTEIMDWSEPVTNEDDYFDEPSEMDIDESVDLNVWRGRKTQCPSSIGNWVQCREFLSSDGPKEGIICGKWRRAPLFIVQSEDWDCSCAVQWDPIHADCAVPQELKTEEVLNDLKLVKWLRHRLSDKSMKDDSN